MKALKTLGVALAAFFAIFAMASMHGLAYAGEAKQAWEKLDYGPDLYGLPILVQIHQERAYEKLVEGDDPYGLPYAGKFHKGDSKQAYEKLDHGDDLYGLPMADKFHRGSADVENKQAESAIGQDNQDRS